MKVTHGWDADPRRFFDLAPCCIIAAMAARERSERRHNNEIITIETN
jgi:hypothetical protein